MMKKTMNRSTLRRMVALTVGLVIGLSFVLITFSEFFITEKYTATAAAVVIDDGVSEHGTINLTVTVRNQAGEDVTGSGYFEFRWEFSATESFNTAVVISAWSDTPGYSEEVTGAGFYRCVVNYKDNDYGTPAGVNPFYTNVVGINEVITTIPYIAVIEQHGNNVSGNVSLLAKVLNTDGTPVSNPEDFTYQWWFMEKHTVIVDGQSTEEYYGDPVKLEGETEDVIIKTNESKCGIYYCEVTYIGDGETADGKKVFYTGNAFYNVTITITTLTGQTTSAPGTPGPGSPTGGFFEGLTLDRTNTGFTIRIINGNNSAANFYYKFILYHAEMVGGVRVKTNEPPVYIPYGEYTMRTTPCTQCGPRPHVMPHPSFGTAISKGSSDSIGVDVVLNGFDDYILEYEVVRFAGNNANQEYHRWGQISFSAGGSISSSETNITTTSEETDIEIDVSIVGYGKPLLVDFHSYVPDGDGEGELDVEYLAYSVTYDPNNGTGSIPGALPFPNDDFPELPPDSFLVISGESHTVRANVFTPPDDEHYPDPAGWNTEADGTGIFYAAGEPINVSENLVLYAQWTQDASPELSFTNADGSPISWILLPSNTMDSGLLKGDVLRVYFKFKDAGIDKVTFSYGGITVTQADFYKLDPDDPNNDIWYFYLDHDVLELLLGENDMIIQGNIEGGDSVVMNVRRIELFNLH